MASSIVHPALTRLPQRSRLQPQMAALPPSPTAKFPPTVAAAWARLAGAFGRLRRWHARRRLMSDDAARMGELSLHVLRDMNADDWMDGRALERKEMERYERAQAQSPIGRFL